MAFEEIPWIWDYQHHRKIVVDPCSNIDGDDSSELAFLNLVLDDGNPPPTPSVTPTKRNVKKNKNQPFSRHMPHLLTFTAMMWFSPDFCWFFVDIVQLVFFVLKFRLGLDITIFSSMLITPYSSLKYCGQQIQIA